MVLLALLALVTAATSAAAEADAVAAATINADRSPDTLLGDDGTPRPVGSTLRARSRRPQDAREEARLQSEKEHLVLPYAAPHATPRRAARHPPRSEDLPC